MTLDILLLLFALVLILFAAEIFTNGVEWLGQHLNLNQGVVGSVLAAVGTALPETLIPFVAVLFFGGAQGHDVGIGAIAGAPFMLSTLTLSLCGWSMWYFAKSGRRPKELCLNQGILSRDLGFFIVAYTLGIAATIFTDIAPLRWLIATVLVLIYPLYLYRTFTEEAEAHLAPENFHFSWIFKNRAVSLPLILLQVLVGLGGILVGAFFFVDHVEHLATALQVPALILSLIIAPIATELPEKVNSILWSRNGKDTLALGNITGAMVFQSCFPVAFGVAFTHWQLTPYTVATGVVAISSATAYFILLKRGQLRPTFLMCGFLVYAVTTTFVILSGLRP